MIYKAIYKSWQEYLLVFPIGFVYEYKPFLDPLLNSEGFFLSWGFYCLYFYLLMPLTDQSKILYVNDLIIFSMDTPHPYPHLLCSHIVFWLVVSIFHFSHYISICVYVCLIRVVTICRQILFCLYMLVSSSQICWNVCIKSKMNYSSFSEIDFSTMKNE